MSASYSYPGVYIQELPSSSHAIIPAPTSIAAFVGYSHPYHTGAFGEAVQIFSFTDYQTYFGGLFSSGITDASLPRAVYQFFLNGGSTAWVVGLQPGLFDTDLVTRLGPGGVYPTFTIPTAGTGAGPFGLVFSSLQPIDTITPSIKLTNVRSGGAVFDVIITYGTQIETYRGITLPTGAKPAPTDPDVMINGISKLVTVAKASGGFGNSYPAAATVPPTPPPAWADVTAGQTYTTGYSAADFLGDGTSTPGIFEPNSTLDNVEIFNLLLIPGITDNAVVSAALAFAERKRAFCIIDAPAQAPAVKLPPPAATPPNPQPIVNWMTGLTDGTYELPESQNGALYYPYLLSTDPVTGKVIPMAPSGFVAGIYAATDASRGVWKAPAGLATNVLNTTGPVSSGIMNDQQQGVLNLQSINCLRAFSGVGTVVWGARTLVGANPAYQQWMYVPVRRMTLFIEQTLLANLRWVVFEPNDEPLWVAITSSISAFMLSLFRQGALQGSTPSDAFQVKCDSTTTSPDDQAKGIVNIVVAFAPLKPAEFVVVKIAQLAGQTAGS
jgi:phage tail sheath protein FI